MPQQIGAYGDAFLVNTPALDNAANMLRQQQRQRDQLGYQDYVATQQILQKEFANARSADIPEIFKAYDAYKNAKQQTLFNQKVINDKTAYAKALQAANENKAKLQQLINQSIDLKEQDKNLSEDVAKNRDLYTDNAGNSLANWMQMPTSQRIQNGYIGNTPLLYQGTNTDFGALEKSAIGEAKSTYMPETKSADGLSYEQKGYIRGNNPVQFYALYSGELAKRKAGQDASAAYKQIPDADKQYLEDEFNKIPDSEWQKWGIQKPQLSQANGQSDAEKFAILKAQQYAVMNPPQDADTKTRDNKGAVLQAQLQNEKTMEGIRQGNRVSLAKLHEQFKQSDKNSQDNFVDGYVEQLKQDAIKNGRQFDKNNLTGEIQKEYKLKLSPATLKLFSSNNNQPDEIVVTPDGSYKAIFYKYTKQSSGNWTRDKNAKGEPVIDTDLSQKFTEDELKMNIAKQFSTPQVNQAMNDDSEDGNSSTASPAPKAAEYSNITETNKGTIGVKNGKWYDIKTGKEIK